MKIPLFKRRWGRKGAWCTIKQTGSRCFWWKQKMIKCTHFHLKAMSSSSSAFKLISCLQKIWLQIKYPQVFDTEYPKTKGNREMFKCKSPRESKCIFSLIVCSEENSMPHVSPNQRGREIAFSEILTMRSDCFLILTFIATLLVQGKFSFLLSCFLSNVLQKWSSCYALCVFRLLVANEFNCEAQLPFLYIEIWK